MQEEIMEKAKKNKIQSIELQFGALSGGECSRKGVKIFYNSLTIILIVPNQICPYNNFFESVDQFIKYIKSAAPIKERDMILIPNELENRVRRKRLVEGIVIEEKNYFNIRGTSHL